MSEENTFQLPEGFKTTAPLRDAKWWKPSKGAILYGRLKGRHARREKGKFYYQIEAGDLATLAKLLKKNVSEIPPMMGMEGRGEEAESVRVEPGDVVNFDERSAIETLAGYAISDGVFDVLIHVEDKIKIPDTSPPRTFWKMTPSVLTVKAPTKPIVQPERVPSDDSPF